MPNSEPFVNEQFLEEEQFINFPFIYQTLLKHKWIIILIAGLTVGLTVGITSRITPMYQASATIEINEAQTVSPLTGQFIYWDGYLSNALYFQTHFRLLTSRPVLERVVSDLNLDTSNYHPPPSASEENIFKKLKKNFFLLIGRTNAPVERRRDIPNVKDRNILALKSKIHLSQIKDTRLITVSVNDHDPAMARNIANSLANAYIDYNTANRAQKSINTLSWMTEKLTDIKGKLEKAEDNFLDFKQENEILFTVKGKQTALKDELAERQEELRQLEKRHKKITEKISILNRIINGKAHLAAAEPLIENDISTERFAELTKYLEELTRLKKIYKPKHPKMVDLNAKIDYSKKNILDSLKDEVEKFEAERTRYPGKRNELTETINDLETQAVGTDRHGLKYSSLQRNVELQQKMYDIVLSKLNEADIIGGMNPSNVRMIEEAVLPKGPVSPNKKKNFLQSIIVGLILGFGVSFLLEYFDQSLRTEEQVQSHLGLPVLSIIPIAQKGKK